MVLQRERGEDGSVKERRDPDARLQKVWFLAARCADGVEFFWDDIGLADGTPLPFDAGGRVDRDLGALQGMGRVIPTWQPVCVRRNDRSLLIYHHRNGSTCLGTRSSRR